MRVAVTPGAPEAVPAELLAVPFTGAVTPTVKRLDDALGGRLSSLLASGEARSELGEVAVLHVDSALPVAAARIALIGTGDADELDEDVLRTAAAAAVGAARRTGGTVAWAFEPALGLGDEAQVRAVVEGALLGGHETFRWRSTEAPTRPDRLVIAGAAAALEAVATRGEIVARWTNRARELVDAPPNEITPDGLGHAASALLEALPVTVEVHAKDKLEQLGLSALLRVGSGSANAPCLIVLRYLGARSRPGVLGLVGKGVTFDSGGLFLKPQDDIVRQKADMGGGAAVIAGVGAIAELGLPLNVLGLVPAAENMIGGEAYRPGDIITTAAGLTVEITNPDAEGRLILADALWYAKQEGATQLVDVATLTGAMRGALGDLYVGVFANDQDWGARVVAAGNSSGDHAWPWPLHRRYRKLLESRLADLRNTAGRSFGYPIVAAAFLERFVGDTPWAHIDIHSTAFLDERRDYLGPGATGAGVRLLTKLAETIGSTA